MRRPPGLDYAEQRTEHAKLKELEMEDRLLSSLRKIRERITIYTCPLDGATGEKPTGHMLQPLKLLMRELQDYFKEPQVERALTKKKRSENKEDSDVATITTVSEELRLIIRDRVEGSAQGLLPLHSATVFKSALQIDMTLNHKFSSAVHRLSNRWAEISPFPKLQVIP